MQIDIEKIEQELRDTIGAFYMTRIDKWDDDPELRERQFNAKDLELSWLTELGKLARIGQTVKEVSEHYRNLK